MWKPLNVKSSPLLYLPDIVLSDYHLFRSMAHSTFILMKMPKHGSSRIVFFRRGIQMLPERWGKVVASNRHYFW